VDTVELNRENLNPLIPRACISLSLCLLPRAHTYALLLPHQFTAPPHHHREPAPPPPGACAATAQSPRRHRPEPAPSPPGARAVTTTGPRRRRAAASGPRRRPGSPARHRPPRLAHPALLLVNRRCQFFLQFSRFFNYKGVSSSISQFTKSNLKASEVEIEAHVPMWLK
jgi:hypothetical protein